MRQALEAVPVTHISRAVSNLPAEQWREMVEASARVMENALQPIRDARNALEESAALMEKAPTEQLRRALDTLPADHKALSTLPAGQVREMVEASARAMENALQPIRDARNALERSAALMEKAPTEQLRRALDTFPAPQMPKGVSTLPAEQVREMVEASARAMENALRPIRDAQNAIDLSVAKMESAPTEQLRKVFESLPVEQMRRALDALPQAQIQNALSGWIEQSGFASSKALAELIDTTMPSPNAKER
jgi:hypothetical protein